MNYILLYLLTVKNNTFKQNKNEICMRIKNHFLLYCFIFINFLMSRCKTPT